jgi:hypothetical protein
LHDIAVLPLDGSEARGLTPAVLPAEGLLDHQADAIEGHDLHSGLAQLEGGQSTLPRIESAAYYRMVRPFNGDESMSIATIGHDCIG